MKLFFSEVISVLLLIHNCFRCIITNYISIFEILIDQYLLAALKPFEFRVDNWDDAFNFQLPQILNFFSIALNFGSCDVIFKYESAETATG